MPGFDRRNVQAQVTNAMGGRGGGGQNEMDAFFQLVLATVRESAAASKGVGQNSRALNSEMKQMQNDFRALRGDVRILDSQFQKSR